MIKTTYIGVYILTVCVLSDRLNISFYKNKKAKNLNKSDHKTNDIILVLFGGKSAT